MSGRYHSSFLGQDIDLDELSRVVADAVGVAYRLVPVAVKCTYPVFRGDAPGAKPAFVKVGTVEEWTRTTAVLREVGDCDLFARPLTGKFVGWWGGGRDDGLAVIVFPWREGRTVFPEDMDDEQARGFVDGCVRLSRALRPVTAFVRDADSPLSPDRVYASVAGYAARHPLAARPLRGLVRLPAEARSYAGRRLAVVHGDFHARNYFFDGGRLSGVFDFDKLTEDLECGDFVQALASRFATMAVAADARRRLGEVTRRMLAFAPWPRDELALMANVWRLRFAARRVERHPDSPLTGVDAYRRDRLLRELSRIIEEKA